MRYMGQNRLFNQKTPGKDSSVTLDYLKVWAYYGLMASLFLGLISASGSSFAGQEKLIWDNWYLAQIQGKKPYYYYQEKLSQDKDQLHMESHVWKMEDGFINEEFFGGFSQDNPSTTPLLFHFLSRYRTTESKVDAVIIDGRILKVKSQTGDFSTPVFKRILPKGTILSNFFPVWMKKNLKKLQEKRSLSLRIILEDAIQSQFKLVPVRVTWQIPDEYSLKTDSTRVLVQLDSQKSYWWFKKNGEYLRTVIPGNGIEILKVSKEKAKSAFK